MTDTPMTAEWHEEQAHNLLKDIQEEYSSNTYPSRPHLLNFRLALADTHANLAQSLRLKALKDFKFWTDIAKVARG